MFILNKIVSLFADPLMAGIIAAAVGVALLAKGFKKSGIAVSAAALTWLWVMGCGIVSDRLGFSLEKEFPPAPAESAPEADAIVLLGGGMSADVSQSPYPEMFDAADRVWHAARLYRAGRAPLVIPTGCGEEIASVPLLKALGVPEDAIRVEKEARNTEENAKLVAAMLKGVDGRRPRVILVTSAIHMRRALLMYRRYAPGLDIVPSAADYPYTLGRANPTEGGIPKVFPNSEAIAASKRALKELVGYWGYRWFRR